tara:strand:+ start:4485 stop:6197 length:1713 start_codon:yes stop_codon:yes gene_type:complete
MIVFKKIRYKNFLSTGNTPIEIDFDKTTTTLVVGTNGSGKSTLLDALCFVLFNKPFRLIKKDQLVNTINQGDCVLEVEFVVGTIPYMVRRGIKPNIFEIYKNRKLINQDANNVDYQKYLEQTIMKLNYRAFVQVVLLGSSSYEPFMKLRPRYRREVVEEILDIRVFGHMDQILRSQQAELQKNLTEMRHHSDLLRTKYESEAKYLASISSKETDFKEGKLKSIEKNNENKEKYEKEIENLNIQIGIQKEKIKDKPNHDNKLLKLNKLESKIVTNLNTHKKTLEFFEQNDICPTCTQPINKEFKIQKCKTEENKVNELSKGLKQLLTEITKTEEKIAGFNKISNTIQDLNIDIAKIKNSLDNIQTHSNNIHEELKSFSSGADIERITKEIEDLKTECKDAEEKLKKVSEEKEYVDLLRDILNDKGAKTKIIKKYLPIMNQLINSHLQSMDFYVNFQLDEEFNETIKSRFRDNFNYNSFSEGEKMRIDLALLFTWRQIAKMKNSTNTNLLMLDEIFDSSLDGQGTDDFFKIVQTLKNENVFVISHKGDILFDKFTNIIKYEKYKNFTRLEAV